MAPVSEPGFANSELAQDPDLFSFLSDLPIFKEKCLCSACLIIIFLEACNLSDLTGSYPYYITEDMNISSQRVGKLRTELCHPKILI